LLPGGERREVMFEVAAEAYNRFMGRYSEPLAARFIDAAGVHPGQEALDVGCGPGALTAQLAARLGPSAVKALDPSSSFVEALRARLPGVEVTSGVAERLPYPDDAFDCALAQLVVHFMADPVAGLAEMARVTRPGGVVAACVWDLAKGSGPLSLFWEAVREVDPSAPGEESRPGTREGHLAELFTAAGLHGLEERKLTVRVAYAGFAEWWDPFTLGIGPSGAYLRGLDAAKRGQIRDRCAGLLPEGAFEVDASAWCVRGRP
jgi:SAM-dependent methyltransferase